MPPSIDEASSFLHKFLRPERRAELFSELDRLPQTQSYYAENSDQALLQGDGWENVDFLNVETGVRQAIRVVILSNTCDMAWENERDVPIRMTISPLVRVSKFIDLLRRQKVDEAVIQNKLESLRRQEISNIFYFPKGMADDEYIIFFDDVQSQSPKTFFDKVEKKRIFSLSQPGFWYFLVKLAIHFCRANESVVRGADL